MVADGLASVVALDGLFKPLEGDQENVCPATADCPTCVPFAFEVQVFVKSFPAAALGGVVLTVTVTSSVAVHPFELSVTVSV